MKINSLNNLNNTSFQAKKIASTSNCINKYDVNIDLYEIDNKDANDVEFLNKLNSTIDYSSNKFNVDDRKLQRWKDVLNYTITNSLEDTDGRTILAIHNDRPYGILHSYDENNTEILDGICAIPDENGYKPPYVGKTMILNFFKNIVENKKEKAKLYAVTDGPFKVENLYKSVGFKPINSNTSETKYQEMSINKYQIKDSINNLEEYITYENNNNEDYVNLNQLA